MGLPPLKGLKVLDLSRVLAGPWAGQTLADLGADVIKVEAPGGDDTRSWGPPFIKREGDESAAYFHAANRGKASVALDFKNADDLNFLKGLASEADVLLENFKLGALDKFGLDFAALSARNPGLIYCSVTGFGQTGPYAERAGYDYLIQGMSGLMSITGAPEGAPQRVGVAITDIFSGLYGVIGILSALRQRDETGRGQHIDISLLDSATAILANQAMNYFATGQAPGRIGNTHPNIVPYQVFEVADGNLIIAVGNDGQFQRLCAVLGRPDLAENPAYATNSARVERRDELVPEIAAALRERARDELLCALEAQNVPAGPIHSVAEALEDPQIAARGLRVRPEGVDGLRAPLVFSDATLQTTRAAPALNADGPAIRAKGFGAFRRD